MLVTSTIVALLLLLVLGVIRPHSDWGRSICLFLLLAIAMEAALYGLYALGVDAFGPYRLGADR